MANRNIVRIHRPELTEEERARRMNEIKKAAIRLLIAAEAERRKTECEPEIWSKTSDSP